MTNNEANRQYEIKMTSKTIHGLFHAQAAKAPENIAISFKDKKLTYKELAARVDQLARVLREKGVKPDTIVGIMVERSIEMLVGMLAVLKAGGAYLPIDPSYPDERIGFMLEDSNTKLVLTQRSLKHKLKPGCEALYTEEEIKENAEAAQLEDISKPTDLAYLIFTSGSTGKPKGVMVEHKAVVNFIEGITGIIDFSEGKRILALTTVSFDIFVLETLLPLTRGLTVILAGDEEQKNPRLLGDLLMHNAVDMLQATPSTIQLLISNDESLHCFKGLKEIMVGGEAFPEPMLKRLKNNTTARIYNMYGPTETTVWSTVSDLTEKTAVDIGKPIANTQIYIINENNEVQEGSIKGELCIAGAGLARGYMNRPEITEEKFEQCSFAPGGIIYRTGDLARWKRDGNLEYIGRIDGQIKFKGHRIEAEEIEACLCGYSPIRQAAVALKNGKDNSPHLCAYFVSEEDISAADLRSYLSNILPEFMIPTHFARMESMPFLLNGKLDRSALPYPQGLITKDNTNTSKDIKANSVEARVKSLLSDLVDLPMSVDEIAANTDLAGLGVDSLTFIKIATALEAEFEFEFEEEDLIVSKFDDFQSLISYVEAKINEQ